MPKTATKMMKAVRNEFPGGPESLKITDLPRPAPENEELLVEVKAAGINRADILQRQGLYPPPPGESHILGLEISGIIAETGKDCEHWQKGQRVFGLLGGGGYAQFAVIHQKMAIPIPVNMSFEEAAAIPEAFLTAYQAICWIGKLNPGESILIHAGASGVGTAAIQLARELNARVFITAGSVEKTRRCLELGADAAINYNTSRFAEVILEKTRGTGVDLILDFVGTPYWEQNLQSIARDGRMVILATMGGTSIKNFDLRALMKKRLTLSGSTLRNRDLSYKIKLSMAFANYALPHFTAGHFKPVIDRIFPWEEVAEAHHYMEARKNIGKIVLHIS